MARNRQPVVFLDTHIAVWLYAGLIEKISNKAKQAIDSCDVLISPLVKLELQYFYEKGFITADETIRSNFNLAVW